MSIFGSLRKYGEDKFNRSTLRLECFLLVCRLESVARCSGRPPGPGDFLSMTEVMSVTPIILVLIILLFGFDSSVSSALSGVRRFFEIF
jgi:hypothetical protein